MPDTDEFRLKIEAYTPETMPMQRLAEYLAQLALMLGDSAAVHFVRLESGSTSVVHGIERESVPKIIARTASVRRGVGPKDSVRAYRRINKMLRDDNGRAVWKQEESAAEILVFPGKDDAEETINGISMRGSIDGEVLRVGGSQNAVPIMLRCEYEELSDCWTNKTTAQALGHWLFKPVRLFGTGRWTRNDEGQWKLDIFRIESFVGLRKIPLSVALNEIRALQTDWGSASYDELTAIRTDGGEKRHGGL